MKKGKVHAKHSGSKCLRGCIIMKGKSALITFPDRFGLLCFIAVPVSTFSLNYFIITVVILLNEIFLFFKNDFVLCFYCHTHEKRWNLRDQGNKDEANTTRSHFYRKRKCKNDFIVIRARLAIELSLRITLFYHSVVTLGN